MSAAVATRSNTAKPSVLLAAVVWNLSPAMVAVDMVGWEALAKAGSRISRRVQASVGWLELGLPGTLGKRRPVPHSREVRLVLVTRPALQAWHREGKSAVPLELAAPLKQALQAPEPRAEARAPPPGAGARSPLGARAPGARARAPLGAGARAPPALRVGELLVGP